MVIRLEALEVAEGSPGWSSLLRRGGLLGEYWDTESLALVVCNCYLGPRQLTNYKLLI